MKENALLIYDKIQDPISYCKEVGAIMYESGIYDIKSKAEGFIVAYNAMAANLSLERYNSIYHTIKGKKVMQSDYMHAEFLRIGGRIEWIKSDKKTCRARFSHSDYCVDGFELEITIDEIPSHLKTKDVWKNWPARMLQCRVISMGIKSIAPIINHGCYSEAEQDAYEKPLKASCENVKTKELTLLPEKTNSKIVDKVLDYFGGYLISKEHIEGFLKKKNGNSNISDSENLKTLKEIKERVESMDEDNRSSEIDKIILGE